MMALRLARAYTGRERVVKLAEHFHGWHDIVVGRLGPDEAQPHSVGVPTGFYESLTILPPNDVAALAPAIAALIEQGIPVVFDVTHSLQLPGGGDGVTAGLAQYITPLASAGVAAGVDGVFLEVHDDPARARSDAQNALRLDLLEPLLRRLMAIDAIAKSDDTAIQAAGEIGRAHV